MFRNEFLHAFDFKILLQNQKIIDVFSYLLQKCQQLTKETAKEKYNIYLKIHLLFQMMVDLDLTLKIDILIFFYCNYCQLMHSGCLY